VAPRTPRLTAGTSAVAVALAVCGLAGARAVGDASRSTRVTGARRAAQASTQSFSTALTGLGRAVDLLGMNARSVAADPVAPPQAVVALVSPNAFSGVSVLPASGALRHVDGLPAAPASVRTDLAPALDLARDTGDPRAGVVGRTAVVVIPVYSSPSVFSTAQRRTTLTAWVVATVDPAALVAQAVPASDRATLWLSGATLTGNGARNEASDDVTLSLGGQEWRLLVTPRLQGGANAMALAVLLLGLLGAAGALAVGARGQRALRASAEGVEALERETRTIAEVGPLLQQSLDLAEVLPAVAVRLSDEFGLDSFAVELIGEQGTLVDVFAVGRPPVGGEPIAPIDGVPAGVEAALPLLRAGRTIGRLRITARDAMTATQLDALRGAADLIAVATYNVELYEREQGTVRRLQELDRLKDAFLGTISHELRTPITAIGGFARMLNDRYDDLTEEQRRDFIRRVGRNSASLGMLVDDLLDFARLERQALQTNSTPMPLDVVLSSFAAQVVPALGDHEVVTDLESGVVALADPRATERILANLLTNAAKFSPAGSPIEVSLRAEGGYAVVAVTDHGPGIAEEDRLRIFTRFYRGDSNVARATRGAGIGLAVVHELVTQMNGEVEARWHEPHGTSMVVRLPLAPSVPAPRTADEPAIARSTS
jgi:signal transduction histidine kinase